MRTKSKHGDENRKIAGTVPAMDWKIEWKGYVSVPISVAEKLDARIVRLRAALERISCVKPDRICHALDVAIIERAARVAADALKGDE